jgi:N-acetylglutamate synthase-like GNAT family acetyltransferase
VFREADSQPVHMNSTPAVQVEAFAEQSDLSDIWQHYGRGASNFWIAVDESRLVGTTGFVDLGSKQGLLRKMFVRSDCRGSGVARLLLANAMK